MGKADIHIHSDYSDGMPTVAEILDHVEECTDLDLIAITDHDMFDGADKARELAARRCYRFQVMTGMEVTTLEGHLLALGLDKPVRSLQRLDHTLAQVHEQGGIAIVPHPMSWLIRSVGRHGILRIHNAGSDEAYFDGIEVLNPSIAGRVTHRQARRLNAEVLRYAETGGSDAHTLDLIGTAATIFEGRTGADLVAAIRAGNTQSAGHFWTREEIRQLARIGPQQSYRALVRLPARHIRRAARSISSRGKSGATG